MKKAYLTSSMHAVPEFKGIICKGAETSRKDLDFRKKINTLGKQIKNETGCHTITLVARNDGNMSPPFHYLEANSSM